MFIIWLAGKNLSTSRNTLQLIWIFLHYSHYIIPLTKRSTRNDPSPSILSYSFNFTINLRPQHSACNLITLLTKLKQSYLITGWHHKNVEVQIAGGEGVVTTLIAKLCQLVHTLHHLGLTLHKSFVLIIKYAQ